MTCAPLGAVDIDGETVFTYQYRWFVLNWFSFLLLPCDLDVWISFLTTVARIFASHAGVPVCTVCFYVMLLCLCLFCAGV
jgi:hypothetical protein